MRKLLKFLHTMGAVGVIGALAALLVCGSAAPPPAPSAAIPAAMSDIATWIFLPALALSLAPGLIAFAIYRPFRNAGWARAKLGGGALVLLGAPFVVAPIRQAALAGGRDGASPALLWALLALASANVALGVFRPRGPGAAG